MDSAFTLPALAAGVRISEMFKHPAIKKVKYFLMFSNVVTFYYQFYQLIK